MSWQQLEAFPSWHSLRIPHHQRGIHPRGTATTTLQTKAPMRSLLDTRHMAHRSLGLTISAQKLTGFLEKYVGNCCLQASSPVAAYSQGRGGCNHDHSEDPMSEIPPLTFNLQFHLNSVTWGHFKKFPNRRTCGRLKFNFCCQERSAAATPERHNTKDLN